FGVNCAGGFDEVSDIALCRLRVYHHQELLLIRQGQHNSAALGDTLLRAIGVAAREFAAVCAPARAGGIGEPTTNRVALCLSCRLVQGEGKRKAGQREKSSSELQLGIRSHKNTSASLILDAQNDVSVG